MRGKVTTTAYCMLVILLVMILSVMEPAQAQWLSGWTYRREVTITNSGSTLTDYQVKVVLTPKESSIFALAKDDGEDIRFTDDDRMTLLNHWIKSWDRLGQSAVVWVKVPNIPGSGSKTIYLYYGNTGAGDASDGDATFEFFDNFDYPLPTIELPDLSVPPPAGEYFDLDGQLVVLTAATTRYGGLGGPHGLSVIEANMGGYKYWGYYFSTSSGRIGLARSNDLLNWDVYGDVIIRSGVRWASAAKVGSTIYLVHAETENRTGNSYVVLEKSTDGIHFGPPSPFKTLVPPPVSSRNQNATLFHNPNDSKWYLYWHSDLGGGWHIYAKVADTIEDLDVAPSIDVISRSYTIAAPSMFYSPSNNLYYLTVETIDNGLSVWAERAYHSTSPTSGFIECSNSPFLVEDIACGQQFNFDRKLYFYVAKKLGSVWSIRLVTKSITPSSGLETKHDIIADNFHVDKDTLKSNNSGFGARVRALKNGSNFAFSDGIVEYKFQGNGGVNELGIMYRGSHPETDNTYHLHPSTNRPPYEWWIKKRVDGTTSDISSGGSFSPGIWYDVKLAVHGNTHEVDVDGTNIINTTDPSFTFGTLGIKSWGTNVGWIDDFRVRKYASPEPTNTVGEEEIITTVSLPIIIYPNNSDK